MLITSIPLQDRPIDGLPETTFGGPGAPENPEPRTGLPWARTPGPIRNAPGVYAAALYVPVKVVPSDF